MRTILIFFFAAFSFSQLSISSAARFSRSAAHGCPQPLRRLQNPSTPLRREVRLAPYFPPTEPYKFTIAHRVFGASNIIKSLQELPESHRADAVSSMVYEASTRIRDPVYGCAGAVCQLQKQVSELQAQLAKAQAETVTMQCQQANLLAIILEMTRSKEPNNINSQQIDTTCFLDDNNLASAWEPLWT
ncbi:LOB domain-containing protein 11 [Hibiscus syriacus]|uniref:LOB domain-containing protein 11 n=1 Tax=Hibiscus syriacus TaxID=106335 RepID=A0A6A2Z3H5_HIBSY|nr:LOB domain-containing protein 11 [Hibiscus syriacus]